MFAPIFTNLVMQTLFIIFNNQILIYFNELYSFNHLVGEFSNSKLVIYIMKLYSVENSMLTQNYDTIVDS